MRTFAHVRPESPRLAHYRDHFGAIGADVDTTPWTEDAMMHRLAAVQPTVAFALLGITKARARKEAQEGLPEASYTSVDYGLTSLLLAAAASCDSRPRFVYLSAAGVGPRAAGAYYGARWRAECEIRQSGLPYVIARPSFITGPDRDEPRPGERVGAAVADTLLDVAGWLGGARWRDRYQSTSNTTLAAALVRHGLDRAGPSRVLESEELRAPAP